MRSLTLIIPEIMKFCHSETTRNYSLQLTHLDLVDTQA